MDLQTTAIESQVGQLLDVGELLPDEDLFQMLQSKVDALKRACGITKSQQESRAINLLDTPLVKSLPSDSQFSIRNFLAERMNNTVSFQRTLKFRKRDIKASRKEREVVALLDSSKVTGAHQGLRPILVSKLTGLSLDKVYRIKNKHLARIKYTPKR